MSDRYSRDREYYRKECRRKFVVNDKVISKTVSSSVIGSQWEVMDMGEEPARSEGTSRSGAWTTQDMNPETGKESGKADRKYMTHICVSIFRNLQYICGG